MNTTRRGGINMRGGIDATFPLTQDQLNDVRLLSAKNLLVIAAENDGGDSLAESAWNTIMNIACGNGTTERKPFDLADRDILAAARTVSPDAVLTSGDLSQQAYGEAQIVDGVSSDAWWKAQKEVNPNE